jgi:hypothetical protein
VTARHTAGRARTPSKMEARAPPGNAEARARGPGPPVAVIS